jgi:hypothetical protein
VGGARVCSIHAKANCLEPVIAAITRGRRYRHVLGFEAGEKARATKVTVFNTERRVGWYPLLDWNWDRNHCLEFIANTTNRQWAKSSCRHIEKSFLMSKHDLQPARSTTTYVNPSRPT